MIENECLVFDSAKGTCFLTTLENDLQTVFDHIHTKYHTQECLKVKNFLKKGSIFHKGDFFLSLRSDCDFFSGCIKDEFLNKLGEIPYIRESEIDDKGNLILCLNRTVLFKSVLKDTMRHEKKYGMKTANKTFLVLVHNEVFKNFDSLRIALIADHLISFLTATGAKVFVNEYRKEAGLSYKEVLTYACTDSCLEQIKTISELIKTSAQDNKWTSITDTESITVDFKKFIEVHSLWFGSDAENITIHKNLPNVVVSQGAYTIHFLSHHLVEVPDCIIHVGSHSQRRKIIDSSMLTEMLEVIDIPQLFITCQTTICNVEPEIGIDTFINYQKHQIEAAMTHKFNSSILAREMWNSYLKTLIDTAVKFYFFRAGTNVPLKIIISLDQCYIKDNKDGIFIQYNYARLSTLLRNFEIKVEEGYYKKLPILDEIDFRLLKFEEEWNLLNFVLTFPRLVKEIFLSITSKQVFSVSRICIMLTKLCHCFSIYYSRIHILGGSQPQLQNTMHARLWLLKGVHQIMYNSFILLNIEGLNKM